MVTGSVAGLLFGTAPALLAIGIGPRAYEVTPRPFGEFLFSLTMVTGGLYLIEDSMWALGAMILSAVLMLMSSKFAVQVLVFCVPIITLLTEQWTLIFLPLVAFGGALLLSGGRYWWILTGQLVHLQRYRRLQNEVPFLKHRNQWRFLWDGVKTVVRSRVRDRASMIQLVHAVENNTYIQLVIRNVLLCGVSLLALFGIFSAWADSARLWEHWLWAWTLTPIFPFLLSSWKPFRFLGEAERYPEYGLAAVCVLAAIGTLRLPADLSTKLLVAYIGLTVPVLMYTFLGIFQNRRKDIERSADISVEKG